MICSGHSNIRAFPNAVEFSNLFRQISIFSIVFGNPPGKSPRARNKRTVALYRFGHQLAQYCGIRKIFTGRISVGCNITTTTTGATYLNKTGGKKRNVFPILFIYFHPVQNVRWPTSVTRFYRNTLYMWPYRVWRPCYVDKEQKKKKGKKTDIIYEIYASRYYAFIIVERYKFLYFFFFPPLFPRRFT